MLILAENIVYLISVVKTMIEVLFEKKSPGLQAHGFPITLEELKDDYLQK